MTGIASFDVFDTALTRLIGGPRQVFVECGRRLRADGVITVSENEIRVAMREIALRANLVAEPSGAVALAAYRRGETPPGPTVVIVSGGNVELGVLAQILSE